MKTHAYSTQPFMQLIKPTLVFSLRKRIVEPDIDGNSEDDEINAKMEEYYMLSFSNDLGITVSELAIAQAEKRRSEIRSV